MNNNTFATRIKELRNKNNLTQKDIADKLGITPTGISYWESGTAVPNYETLKKVAILFNVSIDYLTGYTGEPKNKVVALFKVILYCRICKCAKYNKEWLDAYLDLWYTLFK